MKKTTSELLIKYAKLPSKEQVEILDNALDYMSQYNGRTKTTCILMGMGYQPIGDNYWTKK